MEMIKLSSNRQSKLGDRRVRGEPDCSGAGATYQTCFAAPGWENCKCIITASAKKCHWMGWLEGNYIKTTTTSIPNDIQS